MMFIEDGSVTTRPRPCRRSTADGLKSIICNLYFELRIPSSGIVPSSTGNDHRTRFPLTPILCRQSCWKTRVFEGPQLHQSIDTPAKRFPNKPRSKKILVEIMKTRFCGDMMRDSSRFSGSEVHNSGWACNCELGEISSIGRRHRTPPTDTGNKKHASNCGARDISSIE